MVTVICRSFGLVID